MNLPNNGYTRVMLSLGGKGVEFIEFLQSFSDLYANSPHSADYVLLYYVETIRQVFDALDNDYAFMMNLLSNVPNISAYPEYGRIANNNEFLLELSHRMLEIANIIYFKLKDFGIIGDSNKNISILFENVLIDDITVLLVPNTSY